MTLALLLALVLSPTFADSVEHLYGEDRPAELAALCERAETRDERLLCRYRLYPLTEDADLLEELPAEAPAEAEATETALLAGLWGYRASRGSMIQTIRAGRRAAALLDRARALDPDDPYLLLIEGQSLIFRPALFGGDDEQALRHFRRLAALLAEQPRPGIDPVEVDVWIWYAMHRLEQPGADDRRRELLQAEPPPLYRDFLTTGA